ncbi:insulinase family protein, partial [Pedobacter sp.]
EEYRLTQTDLAGITVADLNAVCKAYVKKVDRDILIMAPETEKANLPNQRAVENWLAQVEAESLQPYKDETSKLPFLLHEPVAGKIIKEEKDEILHTTTLTLSNGVKVVLKPTDFENNQVLFNGFAPGGSSLYSNADYPSAYYAATVIAAAGIGNYSAAELEKYLSGKQASVGIALSERHELVSGGSATNDVETMLQLTYARFTEPRMDKAVFDSFISRNKAGLANRKNDPNSVFADTVNAVLYQGNIRRSGSSITKLEQVNLKRAFEIYKERFSDASNFTFVFMGDFEINAIKPLLEKYLGGLPATHKGETSKDLGIQLPNGKIEKTVYKGTEPKARVSLIFSGAFDYSAAEEIQLEALKEVLQIRLTERLREDESGVYGTNVSEDVSKYPNSRYGFTISFGCGPQNVERLITSVLDEINKLKTSGPLQVNIDKYKVEDQRTRETSLKTNRWWMSYLVEQLQNQEDLHELNAYENNINNVTPKSLKAIANKYLSGKNYIRLVLMPEKEVETKTSK